MKLKCVVDDFVVSEKIKPAPSGGRFALYRLVKESTGTLEAIGAIRRLWNLAPGQIRHCGLKDRHARTTQHVTIRNGPQADLQTNQFRLQYLRQKSQHASARDIEGNRFRINVRDLSIQEALLLCRDAEQMASTGFLNYFDEQRFGSVGASGQFVAAKWCMKEYERALWLALADPNSHDRTEERGQKTILREHWGNWNHCKASLNRSHRRSIVTYLADHPSDFRKAFALLNPDLRGLMLSAFQSVVWNGMVANCLYDASENLSHLKVRHMELPVLRTVPDDGSTLIPTDLPLPSARCKDLPKDVEDLCQRSLSPYSMSLQEMKISFPRDRFFSRGLRSVILIPDAVKAVSQPDELHQHKQCVHLEFELPRGAYATMLIKQACHAFASVTAPHCAADLEIDASDDQPL